MLTCAAQAQEINLDDLGNGPGLLPFKLGPTVIISHFHTFLQDIDIEVIQKNIYDIKLQLGDVASNISTTDLTYFKYHIKHLYSKLDHILAQVDTFLPTRVKRGLLNPLGAIIKEITGNLDHSDALRFEHAIQILNKNEKSISDTFTKHISLFHEMNLQQTKLFTDLKYNQEKLHNALTNVIQLTNSVNEQSNRFVQLVQFFIVLGEKVQDLADELFRLENILAFSRTKSMHHSVLSVQQLHNLIMTLKKYYQPGEIINLDIRNYYEIIRLGTYFVDKRIVIALQFPIIYIDSFDLYRLNPIPNKNNEIILPPYPFMASNSQEYVYIEAECPRVNNKYLCEQKVGHQIRTQRDCIHRLIYLQEIDGICTATPVTLAKEALTELDSQSYLISFPRPTKVQLICGQEKHQLLEGSFLAHVPITCKVKTPEFTIVNTEDKIRGSPIELINIPWPISTETHKLMTFNLTTIDLNNLQNIQKQLITQDPITIDTADDASLYHTTIPVYTIAILSALALVATYIIRRRKALAIRSAAAASNCESSTQADMELERRNATFAVDIGK